jgi:hypothetical protein
MRRAERIELVAEVKRLSALEDRLTRWIEHLP